MSLACSLSNHHDLQTHLSAPSSELAGDRAQAAQAMSAYSDWAPQQYQEGAEQAAASAPADGAQATGGADPGLMEGQLPAENGTSTSGFTYDSNSGAKSLCKLDVLSTRLC